MPVYDIFVLDESNITVSGGVGLDGITQGDGSHLVGETITLNSAAGQAVSITDNDANFEDNDGSQRLNGDHIIDGTTYSSGAVVEAEYSFVLSDGTNTYTVIGFNVRDSSPSYATIEGLAFIDAPPVGVPLTVVSASEGPSYHNTEYSGPICFAEGTLIETASGPRLVEDLAPGDLVCTATDGLQPLRWLYARPHAGHGAAAPILFKAGAIGNRRDLIVSRQHRVRVKSWRSELLFGQPEVLVTAQDMVNGCDIVERFGGAVTYYHLMFDTHQLIWSEGVLSESFQPGRYALGALEEEPRSQLFGLFPRLMRDRASYLSVLPALKTFESRTLLGR